MVSPRVTTLVRLHTVKTVNGRSSSPAGNLVMSLNKLFMAVNTSAVLEFPDLPLLIWEKHT
jgi:hypothetical protein